MDAWAFAAPERLRPRRRAKTAHDVGVGGRPAPLLHPGALAPSPDPAPAVVPAHAGPQYPRVPAAKHSVSTNTLGYRVARSRRAMASVIEASAPASFHLPIHVSNSHGQLLSRLIEPEACVPRDPWDGARRAARMCW
jgi:hypothetical protein